MTIANEHLEISRWFIRQAEDELRQIAPRATCPQFSGVAT